jgi:hypothetical protein
MYSFTLSSALIMSGALVILSAVCGARALNMWIDARRFASSMFWAMSAMFAFAAGLPWDPGFLGYYGMQAPVPLPVRLSTAIWSAELVVLCFLVLIYHVQKYNHWLDRRNLWDLPKGGHAPFEAPFRRDKPAA